MRIRRPDSSVMSQAYEHRAAAMTTSQTTRRLLAEFLHSIARTLTKRSDSFLMTTTMTPAPTRRHADPGPSSPIARTDHAVRTGAAVALWASLLWVSFLWAQGGGVRGLGTWQDDLMS